jgi:hypothetical protein
MPRADLGKLEAIVTSVEKSPAAWLRETGVTAPRGAWCHPLRGR